MGYDDDNTEVKDDKGEFDRFKDMCVTGLYMRDINNNYMYIKGIPLSICNDICQTILKTGYYDLSEYAEYEVLESDE